MLVGVPVPVEDRTWSLMAVGVLVSGEDRTWSLMLVGVRVSRDEPHMVAYARWCSCLP